MVIILIYNLPWYLIIIIMIHLTRAKKSWLVRTLLWLDRQSAKDVELNLLLWEIQGVYYVAMIEINNQWVPNLIRPRLLTPTISVDNRHRMAIATDSLSIKATNKLLPLTCPRKPAPPTKRRALLVCVHGNFEESSNYLCHDQFHRSLRLRRTMIVGYRFMVDLSKILHFIK